MRRRYFLIPVVGMTIAAFTLLQGPASNARPSVLQRIARGNLRPAVLHVNGISKTLPFLSGGIVTTAQELGGRTPLGSAARAYTGTPGTSVTSLGCRNRNPDGDVRVNQDCTFRRQAEEHIAYNPTDHRNLVAGMNDSLIGWNKTSLDFSLDGGGHWGAISTAPFGYRLNAPDDLLPTARDPNSHTLFGDAGDLHSYDACSDPYLTFDSAGRAFYTCVAFNIASNDSLVFVVPSPVGAKGSYFDQVYPPFGLIEGTTGREHIVAEDNNPAAEADGPKVAADSHQGSPNRDVVYSTWTNFNFTCGPNHDQYCESPTYGSMSTNHGTTWSTPEAISGVNPALCNLGNTFDPNQDPHACNFNGHSDIAVLPNGDIVVSYQNANTPTVNNQYLDVHCHPTGSSPAGTAHLNCGTPHKIADEVNANSPRCDLGGGPEQCIPGAFIRGPMETSQRIAVNQRTGTLFDTWYDYRTGEFDIFVARSTDGGSTWSRARRVNPDVGTDHYFSAIDIGEAGTASNVGVSYYRTARIPNENTTPSGGFAIGQPGVGLKLSDYVLSGGSELSTPFAFAVISPRFPAPDGIQVGFNGDYSGLAVIGENQAHPIWSDTRNMVIHPAFDHGSVDEDVFTISRDLPRS